MSTNGPQAHEARHAKPSFFTRVKMLLSPPKLAEYRKGLAAAAGVLAQAIELGVLHGTALHDAQIVSSVIAAVLVVGVPNRKPAAY